MNQMAANLGPTGPQSDGVKHEAVDWDLVYDRLVRAGWLAAWVAAVVVGLASLSAGSSVELAVIRAGAGLVGVVLIGWFAALLVTRLVPEDVTEDETSEDEMKGVNVDQTLGDDMVWPNEAEEGWGDASQPAGDAGETPPGVGIGRAA